MKQIYYTKKSGFSLVESMIAVFIFSLLSMMLSGAFSSFLKNFSTAKKAQRNAESVQYAMNLMSKTIRTSTLDPNLATPPATFANKNQITMFDNSISTCVTYKYNGSGATGNIQIFTEKDVVNITDITKCNQNPAPSSFSDLTKVGEIYGGSFSGILSVDGASFGKVLISTDVDGTNASKIQTTVSLRQ